MWRELRRPLRPTPPFSGTPVILCITHPGRQTPSSSHQPSWWGIVALMQSGLLAYESCSCAARNLMIIIRCGTSAFLSTTPLQDSCPVLVLVPLSGLCQQIDTCLFWGAVRVTSACSCVSPHKSLLSTCSSGWQRTSTCKCWHRILHDPLNILSADKGLISCVISAFTGGGPLPRKQATNAAVPNTIAEPGPHRPDTHSKPAPSSARSCGTAVTFNNHPHIVWTPHGQMTNW